MKIPVKAGLVCLKRVRIHENSCFVEFSPTNGIGLSNTYLMETKFGWNKILAEPTKTWQYLLKKNRSAVIETKCVWHSTAETLLSNELSDKKYTYK